MAKISARRLILAAIICLSLLGGYLAIYTTLNGPWGYSDPMVYISTARNLDRGMGLVYYEADATLRSITIEPPFYPLALAAIGFFHPNMVAAARWLNILAFVASIFIAGWLFYRYSRAPALGIIASALLCVFPYMLWMFSSAYSEPLFILMFLLGGWSLLAYLRHPHRTLWWLSAILIGLVPLTRYAGVAMLLAAGATLLLCASGKFSARLKNALLFSLVASLPILLWLAWIYFAPAHSLGGRSLGLDLPGLSANFQSFRGIFMDTVWKWVPFQSHDMLLRYMLRFILMGVGLLVLLGLVLWAYRRLKVRAAGTRTAGFDLFTFFGLSALIFLAVLVVTYLFTHPTIDVDNRMLLPLFVGSLIAIFAAFAIWQAAWFSQGKMRLFQSVAWLIAILCVAWYVPQTRQEAKFYRAGDGLTAYRWNDSVTVQMIRDLPADTPVISNDWEMLQLWTGRPIYGFWNTLPLKPGLQSTPYGTVTTDPVQSVFCRQAALLVIVNTDFDSEFQSHLAGASTEQLQQLFAGLQLYQAYPDATIYQCP